MRAASLVILALALGACSDPDEPPRPRATRAESPASASGAAGTSDHTPADPSATAGAEGAAGARRVRGVFYTITLPEGAHDGVPSEPDVVDSVYVLSAADDVTLSLFRPFPQQSDLDTWTRTVETILEGLPQRYDETRIAGLPARVAELPGELRWTLVVDGMGHLYRCTAAEGQDAAWLHERCDETVQSLTLVRAIE